MDLKREIDINKVPTHVAIIMDGNGRWAKQRGKDRIYGHKEGANSVKAVIKAALEINIKYLTLYAFSIENWQRPKQEVDALFNLLIQAIEQESSFLVENNIRFMHIGIKQGLSMDILDALKRVEQMTNKNDKLNLIIALNYGSRIEIIEAVKKIALDIKNGELILDDINENIFSEYLFTNNIPDPDLLIRTSGEIRISNFLLWQLSYTELYFTPTLWPDFRERDFYEAIIEYQRRERRFGKISEQL